MLSVIGLGRDAAELVSLLAKAGSGKNDLQDQIPLAIVDMCSSKDVET